jgi:hypothetical protein
MNLDELEIRPSVNQLYAILGQERIMSFYFHDLIVMNKRYSNPFRDDSNPGCFFKWSKIGNLYFVDYATQKIYYNPIDIACMRTGYGYPDILYKIEADFNIKNLNLEDKKQLELETSAFQKPEMKPATIKVSVSKFNKKDYDYWNQFGINDKILSFYNVKKVSKVWIAEQLWYIHNDSDPCYRYVEKEKFKIYRPLADKKNKFRTNYFGGLLEGYTQLPHKGELLIITKGLKDVMTLHSLGINAVAVRSENTPVSENAFNLLKNRFDKIIVWFDADEAGIIGAHKLSTMYNLPVIYHNKELGKDPSEIYRNFGKEIILKIIKENENKKDENLTTVRNT